MNELNIQSHSKSWIFFVKFSFVSSLLALAFGIFYMPGDIMLKGYIALGCLFLISSTMTMAKTLRDEHESQRLIYKVSDAKTSKIINEYAE